MKNYQSSRPGWLYTFFKPIIRLCLKSSTLAPSVLEAIKLAYVHLAQEELTQQGESVTVSKVAIMTGLNRREVDRLVRAAVPETESPNIITRVIGQWEQDPRFSGKSRTPKVLSYKGSSSEFKRLVRSVNQDLSPPTILFELRRRGFVEVLPEGIKLMRTIDYRDTEPQQGLSLVAQEIESLVLSAEENLYATPHTKNLHLCTAYDNIFCQDLPEIREWLLSEGIKFHKRARDFLSAYDEDFHPQSGKKGGMRVVFGTFSWTSKPVK